MRDVTLCECFARDGLQHEPDFLPTPEKRRLVERFAEIGFQRVEATSYSNPAVIPQFADASALLATLQRRAGVFYKATCANVRAVERAVGDLSAGHGANEISLLVSASESHSLRNLKRSRADQWLNIQEMADKALNQFRLIGTVSVAFGCPFEGRVSEAGVLADVEQFAKRGVKFVTLGDTTGVATPQSVKRLFSAVLATFPEITPIAHFHDTRATGLVNYVAALEAGVTWYDCAFGGVGGHPAKVKYGGGHTGNVSTEDWVNLLESMGVRTGIDLHRLLDVAAECEAALGRELHSRVLRSGLNPLLPITASQTTSSNEQV
jgi:hydroxymethylglutaryl-CoA lyase